ncbi:MAG: hypothetical protein L3J35_02800 [Bacteroidales bacterium]|nr:hypothetical protein [Bacteroidales bacterium]
MEYQLKEIIDKIEIVEFTGNPKTIIKNLIKLNPDNEDAENLFWCNDKNLLKLNNLKAGTVIVSNNFDKKNVNTDCNYIITENPRRTFMQVVKLFFYEKETAQIAASTKIHDSVKIGKNVFIGENVVIEKKCTIGDNTRINHNTVIFKDTIIGHNVVIGSNCTVGGIGFGYEKDKEGKFELIPHIGNVIIENNVEIGNNTCIDKAVLGSTILKENSKIDNLVHIAHGVTVGENSVVIANAMVAGSVMIGKNVWIAPSASILNQLTIEDNSLVGMAANVVKKVNEREVVAGNPAKFIKKVIE